ncbi:EamA family transporter [Martelella alba]|uniref:O-acetylserine/cysteine exporter n=1 Tax=Martelella alba TaxID=2590451 RepID=A0ABY2SQ74_9HYPH|nr:EamA family transporter [Martelella alba]TKI05989.1 O-acetylserine/cysteine exporter [Martelella alba]
MSTKDTILALCVILVWGLNFVVIKVGVTGMPPFLLAGIRFVLISFPLVLFVKPPKVDLKLLILYGMSISFGQFALLFLAIKLGMPSGIASLVVQAQAFFTILLGKSLGEKIKWFNTIGMIVAVIGMYVVGTGVKNIDTHGLNLTTMLLTLGAALCWGIGNITNKLIMKDGAKVNGLSLVVWGALVPIIPFFLCSFIFEGTDNIIFSLKNINGSTIFSIVYLSFIASIVGFVLWSNLMSRYESSKVAPLTLVVPIIGMISSYFILGETVTGKQIVGATIVIIALLINNFGGKFLVLISEKHHA